MEVSSLYMRVLISVGLCCLLCGCFIIGSKGSFTSKDAGLIFHDGDYYSVNTKKGKIEFDYDIGHCGVRAVLILPIIFGVFNCEDNFRIHVYVDRKIIKKLNIIIKYNNQSFIHNKEFDHNFTFKNINTDELKKAKDAKIIIKDGDELIAELPFEWGVSIFMP